MCRLVTSYHPLIGATRWPWGPFQKSISLSNPHTGVPVTTALKHDFSFCAEGRGNNWGGKLISRNTYALFAAHPSHPHYAFLNSFFIIILLFIYTTLHYRNSHEKKSKYHTISWVMLSYRNNITKSKPCLLYYDSSWKLCHGGDEGRTMPCSLPSIIESWRVMSSEVVRIWLFLLKREWKKENPIVYTCVLCRCRKKCRGRHPDDDEGKWNDSAHVQWIIWKVLYDTYFPLIIGHGGSPGGRWIGLIPGSGGELGKKESYIHNAQESPPYAGQAD